MGHGGGSSGGNYCGLRRGGMSASPVPPVGGGVVIKGDLGEKRGIDWAVVGRLEGEVCVVGDAFQAPVDVEDAVGPGGDALLGARVVHVRIEV